MKFLTFGLFFLLLPGSLLTVHVNAEGEKEFVVEYDDSNFSEEIAKHDTVLVLFGVPKCIRCSVIYDDFNGAAAILEKNGSPIILAVVSCTNVGRETCKKHAVKEYPTLKLFKKGKLPQDYEGPFESAKMVEYLEARAGPSSKELSTAGELDEFLAAAREVCLVGFFEEESELKDVFLKLAEELRGKVRFAHFTSKDVLGEEGLRDDVVLYRPVHLRNKFEENKVVYSGPASPDGLNGFIAGNRHGLVGVRTVENQGEFGNPLVVAYYDVDYARKAKVTHYWRNRVLKIAEKYQGVFNFAISSKREFMWELRGSDTDLVYSVEVVVMARDAKNQKFVMMGRFSVEALERFLEDVQAGKVEVFLRSEPLPVNNNKPVKIAVGKNFKDVVTNNGKDTLILFYTFRNADCRKLIFDYHEAATKLRMEDVALVQMNIRANDVPFPYEVQEFPTIYWVKKDLKDEPVKYEGGWKVGDFVTFVAKHSSEELKGFDREGREKQKTEL